MPDDVVGTGHVEQVQHMPRFAVVPHADGLLEGGTGCPDNLVSSIWFIIKCYSLYLYAIDMNHLTLVVVMDIVTGAYPLEQAVGAARDMAILMQEGLVMVENLTNMV